MFFATLRCVKVWKMRDTVSKLDEDMENAQARKAQRKKRRQEILGEESKKIVEGTKKEKCESRGRY